MTADDVKGWLDKNGRTALWLAEAAGYKPTSIYNAISQNRFTDKLEKAILRAFGEEERRMEVDLTKPDASVWELVYFNGQEAAMIDRAKKAGGYDSLPPLYKDAVIHFADHILAQEAKRDAARYPAPKLIPGLRVAETEDRKVIYITRHGSVAAGGKSSADVVEEEIPAGKQYPKDHYALRVLGQSMEPTIPDGSVIVVKAWKEGYPRKGTIVVYNDGYGASLKVYDTVKAEDPENPGSLGKVPVLKSINPEFPNVETLEGGRIDATFVEILSSPETP